jgi:hypothetical protein
VRWRPLAVGCLLALTAGTLSAQADMTLTEAARWLERDGTDLAVSSGDETATSNLRRVAYTASATLALDKCQLTIVVTDNSGVSGTRTEMRVPLKQVNADSVRAVSRPEGYHDFIAIPGQYFVTIPARAPDTYPFRTITSRGELRSYLATIPVRDRSAGTQVAAVLQRAARLCAAPGSP